MKNIETIGTTTIDNDLRGVEYSNGKLYATVYQYNADRGTGRMYRDLSRLDRMNDPDIIQLRKNLALQAAKKNK